MFVEVISPAKIIFSGEADLVELPGEQGRFQILHEHAPLMATLTEGSVLITKQGKIVGEYNITSGYAEVKVDKVVVLINEI